jgi:hypothetical protein
MGEGISPVHGAVAAKAMGVEHVLDEGQSLSVRHHL